MQWLVVHERRPAPLARRAQAGLFSVSDSSVCRTFGCCIGLDLTHGHMIGGNSYVRQHRSVDRRRRLGAGRLISDGLTAPCCTVNANFVRHVGKLNQSAAGAGLPRSNAPT